MDEFVNDDRYAVVRLYRLSAFGSRVLRIFTHRLKFTNIARLFHSGACDFAQGHAGATIWYAYTYPCRNATNGSIRDARRSGP